jgi:glycosyltransferase involved in cell wall biosynthesis
MSHRADGLRAGDPTLAAIVDTTWQHTSLLVREDSTRRVALVMPAYNEASVIGEVIDGLPREVDGWGVDVVVVNDGSTDATAQEARRRRCVVIDHLVNSGSGGATTTGLRYATERGYPFVVTIDADGQHASADCVRVIRTLLRGEADVVIGSRLIDSAGMPWYRVLGNRGLNLVTYLLLGATASDTQSGLKGFSPRALERIRIRSSGMEFCSEIVWRAKQHRLTVEEIPIRAIYTDYSLAKGQSNWNALSIIMNLLKRRVLELLND